MACISRQAGQRKGLATLLGGKGDRHRLCQAPFGPLRGKRSQSPLPRTLAAPQLKRRLAATGPGMYDPLQGNLEADVMNAHLLYRCSCAVLLLFAAVSAVCLADQPASAEPRVPSAAAPAADRTARSNAEVKDLIAVLETGKDEARFEAALALADLGPQAASAVPALIKELKRDAAGSQAALDALVRIGAPPRRRWANCCDSRDVDVRRRRARRA